MKVGKIVDKEHYVFNKDGEFPGWLKNWPWINFVCGFLVLDVFAFIFVICKIQVGFWAVTKSLFK